MSLLKHRMVKIKLLKSISFLFSKLLEGAAGSRYLILNNYDNKKYTSNTDKRINWKMYVNLIVQFDGFKKAFT